MLKWIFDEKIMNKGEKLLRMIIEEFKNLKRHKILIATILGIMSLPFLYSLFFLKSVWDPYGSTSYLPVAVVNKDQATYYQGKKFQVGHDLVSKLKDNDDLEWHFVSEKEANDGLSHKKYYMVITIPKNFSKNATTVLNRHPHKMNLTYKTNDSLNYIGKVISETGVKQVNSEIRESVSTAYADTMFKVVKKVGKGFNEAASGSKQLADGSKVLNDGLNTYTAGVGQVNNGVIQLAAGVVPLSDGVQKLTAGSTALATGLKTYTAGVSQVNNGVQTLNSSTGTLATGVNALATGSNSLKDGIGQYTAGVSQVANNSQKLRDLSAGIAQVYIANQLLSTGLQQQLQAMNGLTGQQVEQLTGAVNSIDLDKLKTNLNDLNTLLNSEQMNELVQTAKNLPDLNKKLNTEVGTFEQTLTNNLGNIGTSAQVIGTSVQSDADAAVKVNNGIGSFIKANPDLTESQKQQLQSIAAENAQQVQKNVGIKKEQLTAIANNLSNTQVAAGQLKQNLTPALQNLASQTDTLQKLLQKLPEMKQQLAIMNNLAAKLPSEQEKQVLLAKMGGLQDSIKQLQASVNSTAAGAAELNKQVKNDSINAAQLAVLARASQTSSPAALQAQIQSVANTMIGNSELVKLANGTNQLASKNAELNSGASQLAGGLGTLNANVPALTSGVSQLASGTSQLVANNGQLNSGASQLAGGLGTLNAQIPTMTNGVNQLASGTGQLAANSSALTDGSDKIYKGNKKLAKSMKQGANTIKKVKTGKDNAKMFAAPSNLVEKHYSYVPNYGYALAPYMLSVALFVGAMVFNLVYPIRRLESEDETAFEWFMAKVAIGSIVAIGNALVEALLMIAVGLHPDHLGAMLANGILFSLAMMFLIMFFSVAFQNPGRFLCMILLVIQLGASGGSFPIEITKGLGGFFQAVNPYLPMTYSIYGFRQALTSGLGASQMITSYSVSLLFLVISLGLLYVAMVVVRPNVEYVEEVDINNYTKQN